MNDTPKQQSPLIEPHAWLSIPSLNDNPALIIGLVAIIFSLGLAIYCRASLIMAAKQLIRYLLIESLLGRIIRSPAIGVFSGLGSIYLIARELFPEHDFFTKYETYHNYAIVITLAILGLHTVFKSISDYFEERAGGRIGAYREELQKFASQAVGNKTEKLIGSMKKLNPDNSVYATIAHPEDQINFLVRNTTNLIQDQLKIKSTNLKVSVVAKRPQDKSFTLINTPTEEWKQTPQEIIVEENSMASKALRLGHSIFIPDKIKGAKNKEYYLSTRDLEHSKGAGSGFCYPVICRTPNHEMKAFITVVTYNVKLCDDTYQDLKDAMHNMLDGICERMNLELLSISVKDWQQFFHRSGENYNKLNSQ